MSDREEIENIKDRVYELIEDECFPADKMVEILVRWMTKEDVFGALDAHELTRRFEENA